MSSSVRRSTCVLDLDQLVELFARVADRFGTLSLDFGSDHEAANVRFTADQQVMGVRSLGFAASDANKVVNIQSDEEENRNR